MHLIVKALIVVVCIHAHFCYEKCPNKASKTLRYVYYDNYTVICDATEKPEAVEWFHFEKNKRVLKWEEKTNITTIDKFYERVVFTGRVEPRIIEVKKENKIVQVYATMLTLYTEDHQLRGMYCCQLTFPDKVINAVVVYIKIYDIYMEVTQCSDHENILLECKTYEMDEKVTGANFYEGFIDESNMLKGSIIIKSIQVHEHYYHYNATMIIPISYLRDGINLKAVCELVVEDCERGVKCPKITTLPSKVNSPGSGTRKKGTCLQNVRMNKKQLWGKAGNDSVKIYCTFDVPLYDQTESINWYHLKFSTERPISFWKRGQKIVTDDKYKSVIDTKYMKPSNFSDRQATALAIMNRLNHSGIYRCDVEFRDARSQSDEANFIVYQIEKTRFTVVGCTEGNVRLECVAENVDPKPVGVAFTVQDITHDTHLKLNYTGTPQIYEALGSNQVYALMITPYIEFQRIVAQIRKLWCHIVFNRDPEIKDSYAADIKDYIEAEKEKFGICYPKVVLQKHSRWVKAGSDPFMMTCKFEHISDIDNVESIQWFHNIFRNAPFYKWNKTANLETILGGYKVAGKKVTEYMIKQDIRDKMFTSNLTFQQVRVEYSGNYTCQVAFQVAGKRSSNESSLVVYQIDPYYFVAIGCRYDVRLQCKARNTYPEPLGVVFSVYSPTNDAKLRLNNKVSVEVLKENEAHNIIATIDPIDQFTSLDASSKFECQVILNRNPEILGSIWTTRKTSVIDNRGRSTDVCSPKVEVDPPLKWAKVGMESLVLRCKFELPLLDGIHSIRWVHRNISELATDLKHDELTSTFDDSEETSDIIKKIERVAFEHSGRYSCEVNFQFAGKHRGHSVLVVYQIENPYYFEAERYGDDEITLVCRAANLFPKPVDIVFSEYQPETELKSVLNTEVLPETIEVGGFFNIIANVTIYESRPESVHYACDVVLSKDPEVLATSFTSLPPINLLEEQAKPNKTDDKGSSDIPIAVFIAVSAAGAILVARLA